MHQETCGYIIDTRLGFQLLYNAMNYSDYINTHKLLSVHCLQLITGYSWFDRRGYIRIKYSNL